MDQSCRELPSPVLALYARILPPCGGDTLLASLEAAYVGLDDEMKARIDGLHTLQKSTPAHTSRRRYTEAQIAAMQAAPPVCHPLTQTRGPAPPD